jgi:hypothetical protein
MMDAEKRKREALFMYNMLRRRKINKQKKIDRDNIGIVVDYLEKGRRRGHNQNRIYGAY